jgi:hypothetical protein
VAYAEGGLGVKPPYWMIGHSNICGLVGRAALHYMSKVYTMSRTELELEHPTTDGQPRGRC